jgi:perosamine synthetase
MNKKAITPIPITKTVFGPEEMKAIQGPLETGWIVQGPKVKEFEGKFSAYTRAPHAIATTSCTTALHISVAALQLKPGQEVIVPAFTWIATANVVEYMGGKPVFCDVDLATFNLDPKKLEACITPKTVGIIPVHLFGLCADMNPIMEIAKKHKLWVVEDAACAFGAWYHGKHAGTFGDTGCFSFHPRKSITTGEGGMITTMRQDLEPLCRSLRDHGASRSDLARHQNKAAFLLSEYKVLGYNFRMTDFQGALGSAQMDRAVWILESRTACARRYDALLKGWDWLQSPSVPKDYVHGYQAYVCLFKPEKPSLQNVEAMHEKRNELMMKLEEEGIATRQGTHAVVIQDYYVKKYGLRPEMFPNAYLADKLTLTLPLFPQLTEPEQQRVIEELKDKFKK